MLQSFNFLLNLLIRRVNLMSFLQAIDSLFKLLELFVAETSINKHVQLVERQILFPADLKGLIEILKCLFKLRLAG